jgi:hypothetical protein
LDRHDPDRNELDRNDLGTNEEPDRQVTDEGLGLDAGHRDVDPEEDTGLIAPASAPRYRPHRRPQAERMR